MRMLLVLALLAAFAVSPASALAPEPWRVVEQGTKSGRDVSLLVTGRWTYNDEYGPTSGLVEKYPIPKALSIVVTATPRQRVQAAWTILCYANREYPAVEVKGRATAVGRLTVYPHLFAKRVECDPYVHAHLPGKGTVSATIYAY